MGILLRNFLLLFVIIGLAVILPGASGVEQRDYEEALKDDEPAESLQQSERSTEYPNGVNVIPGSADIHYPTYDKIPKSAFSCHGRIPGFYADPELRCQVWHICDESGVQQSFLCTNGTIYSQDKRVCDWWYNVNCDPEEVARNYAQNSELYKGPPPKEGNAYEEAPNNELPPPPPTPSHKKPVQQHQQQRPQQQQQQQRPQNYEQPQQRQPQHQPSQRPQQQHPQRQPQQNYEQSTQRPQNQNYNQNQPQQTRDQQQDEEERAAALKILEAYEQQSQSQQSGRPQNQNYENKPQQSSQQQRAQEQKRAEALQVIQNYERAQSQYRPQNYEAPQARRQPTASQQNSNYIAPTPPTRTSHGTPPPPPPPNGGPAPEKKRVIVLRLPGPLPPGATIPPHILMEYAESVLAAERAGKAPPPGLVSSKTVTIPQNQAQQQRPQPPPQQHHNQHQQRPQPQQQHQQQQHTRPQQPAPTQPPQPETSSPAPAQRVRPSPKGPTLPYTPRPFSAFLEAAVKHNGQSKGTAAPVQQQQQEVQQRPQPTQPPQQHQHRPQQSHNPHHQQHQQQQQQQQQQQRRYEEPRQTPRPQNYEQQQPQQRRPVQQQQPEEPSYSEEQPRQQQQQPAPQKKTPVQQHKPSKSGPPPSAVDSKKFRHSTPRKHGEIRFAPKSSVNFDDLEDHVEESRRPAYFNNLAPVPHLAQDFYSTVRPVQQQTYQTQPPKGDVHLKSSFDEVEKVTTRNHRVKQYQEPIRTLSTTTTTERYLTAEEIHEPAIKRLVVVAGLKIKDPRNKQLTTPTPSRDAGSSEEDTYQARDKSYEPVRLIVSRKSTTTTTYAPETYPTTTSAPTRATQQQQYQSQQRNHQHHYQRHQQVITQAPTTPEPVPTTDAAPAPRVRPTPKGPTLPYTPRPFSAFLEAAVKYNGQSKGLVAPTPPPQQTPAAELEPQVSEEVQQRPVMRRIIRKKIRVNHQKANVNSENVAQPSAEVYTHQGQNFQKIPRTTTYTPVQTTRKPTTTSTTPYYQPEDYYEPIDHSTKATKNFGFDVYGQNEDEDEEEQLLLAAQEYYQFSENYGKKQRY